MSFLKSVALHTAWNESLEFRMVLVMPSEVYSIFSKSDRELLARLAGSTLDLTFAQTAAWTTATNLLQYVTAFAALHCTTKMELNAETFTADLYPHTRTPARTGVVEAGSIGDGEAGRVG